MVSYNNEPKKESRKRFKQFIEDKLFSHPTINPRKVKVLCLPGAENQEEVALELTEVYDPLGIPRQNIIGLERDFDKYNLLKKSNLGINLYNSEDIEYLEKAKYWGEKFDIVSLDWMGPISSKRIYGLELIASDQLLTDHSILLTNLLGKRENRRTLRELNEYQLELEKIFSKTMNTDSMEFLEKRDDVISWLFSYLLLKGKMNLNPTANEKLALQKILPFVDDKIFTNPESSELGRNSTEKILRNSHLRLKLQNILFNDRLENANIKEIMFHYGMYFKEDHERYKYQSTNSSPMLLDLYHFEKRKDEIRNLRRLEKSCSKNDPKALSIFYVEFEKFKQDTLRKSLECTTKRVEIGKKKIVEKVNRKQKKLTKEKAIELLKSGKTIDEILKDHTGFTKGQLGAFKAWITMGKY